MLKKIPLGVKFIVMYFFFQAALRVFIIFQRRYAEPHNLILLLIFLGFGWGLIFRFRPIYKALLALSIAAFIIYLYLAFAIVIVAGTRNNLVQLCGFSITFAVIAYLLLRPAARVFFNCPSDPTKFSEKPQQIAAQSLKYIGDIPQGTTLFDSNSFVYNLFAMLILKYISEGLPLNPEPDSIVSQIGL